MQREPDLRDPKTLKDTLEMQEQAALLSSQSIAASPYESASPDVELGMWLRAIRSYADSANHANAEPDLAAAVTRNWIDEVRIARRTLLRISQLALRIVHTGNHDNLLLGETDDAAALGGLGNPHVGRGHSAETLQSLIALTEVLGDVCAICDALLEAHTVSFHAWTSLGKILKRELGAVGAVKVFTNLAAAQANQRVHPHLHEIINDKLTDDALGADMALIFADLTRLLEWLCFVETSLRRDHPLKQTLPIFCMVYEETRQLLSFIESRVLRSENLAANVFEVFDGTNYALTMELRKVFTRELVGLSALRQSPPIYAKVENAHGLLRDCFQQSAVGLAQLIDPSLEGTRLFTNFQTKLDQSVRLRSELWQLLLIVRKSESNPDTFPASRLHEALNKFRFDILRYLMFKDWETSERFVEEIKAARGAVELKPVLHRFGAYIETLHGQVNMRAILATHPFSYPELAG